MAFDKSLDVTILVETIQGDRAPNIEFKVASYKGGEPKLQLTRIRSDGAHQKLGRLTQDEIKRVRDKLTELLEMHVEDEKPKPLPQNVGNA